MARLLTPSSRAAQTAKDLPTVTCAFLYQYTFIAGARSLGALRQPRDDTTKALYPLRIRGASPRKNRSRRPGYNVSRMSARAAQVQRRAESRPLQNRGTRRPRTVFRAGR